MTNDQLMNITDRMKFDDGEQSRKSLLYSPHINDIHESVDMKKGYQHFNNDNRQENEINIASYRTVSDEFETHASARFYKEVPGWSPTVSISWYITKVHLSNLYYTTLRDYSIDKKMCNEIINTYKGSYNNKNYYEYALPVILYTKWTSVYDKELQAMLGFNSICSFIFYETSRHHSVSLGVCPVLFALYLKYRCAADQRSFETMGNCRAEYSEHDKQCDAKYSQAIGATLKFVDETWWVIQNTLKY